jgi:ankyrin repeat protein
MKREWRGLTGAILAIALLAGAILPNDRALLDAAKRGDVVAVKQALKSGADVNAAQGDGLTALHIAAQEGRLDIAKLLIGAKANVEARTKIGGYTPLHLAAASGSADLVKTLLDAGADAKVVTTTTQVTPLHLAAKALNGEAAVKLLADKGVDVNAKDRTGETPLMFAAAAGRTASVKELLAHKADASIATPVTDVLQAMVVDRAAQQKLREAAQEIRKEAGATDRGATTAEEQKAIAAERAFLSKDENVKAALKDYKGPESLANKGPSFNTPAGYSSPVEIVHYPQREMLVQKEGGMTALLLAAREGRIDAAQALIEGGANINQVSGDGSTPLVISLLNGQFDLSMMLIQKGADPSLATTTDGVSPAFAVLQTQWAFKFGDHNQPRAQESQKVDYLTVLKALIAAHADVNQAIKTHLWYSEYFDGKLGMDITGATPFWRAAMAQDLTAMKLLADAGADVNVPTHYPAPGMRYGRQNDGRLQEDSGLPILPEGTPNMYPIHAAAGGGYLGLGAFMMNNVPNNFLPSVKYLVEEKGADVNLPDGWGYTPLHYAASRGDNAMIEYLVSKGANIKAVTRLGQSVADMARGGRAGYFDRTAYPETVALAQKLGSPLLCLHTHFRGTGDYCAGTGVISFDSAAKIEPVNSTRGRRPTR